MRESKGSGAQKKATKSPGGIRASNCEDFSNPYFPPFFPVICWTFYLIVRKEGGVYVFVMKVYLFEMHKNNAHKH